LLWQASPFVAEQQVTMGWLLIIFFVLDFGSKIREKKRSAQYLKTSVLSIAHHQNPAKAG